MLFFVSLAFRMCLFVQRIPPLHIFFLPCLVSVQREWKRKYPAEVLAINEQAASVLHLTLRKPSDFDYRPGQYLFLNCAQIATFEWHPFTITSSPLEETLAVHIRNLGNWTGALHKLASDSVTKQV